MKRLIIASIILSASLFSVCSLYAGNEDRTGEAGAYELLINPWARSSGWGNSNVANVHGIEAVFGNIAGTAFTQGTELIFSHSIYLDGSGISINSFGLSQKTGKTGVFTLAVMSMDFGEIPITTQASPDGGLGNFDPKFMNINISYSKAFSNSIYGGINVKLIDEAISNVTALGVGIDAGIQYVTGARDNIKFGISLKNMGTPLKFSGDGLSITSTTNGYSYTATEAERANEFELPTQLNMGAAYDFKIPGTNTLTAAATFTSNSFSKDEMHVGLEFGYKGFLFLRGGFTYEKGLFSSYDLTNVDNTRTTPYTGPAMGVSVAIPLNKQKGTKFTLDYAYQTTNPFQGTQTMGVGITF